MVSRCWIIESLFTDSEFCFLRLIESLSANDLQPLYSLNYSDVPSSLFHCFIFSPHQIWNDRLAPSQLQGEDGTEGKSFARVLSIAFSSDLDLKTQSLQADDQTASRFQY